MTTGVTASGFLQPTTDEITQSIGQGFRDNINSALDTSPDQPLGQIASTAAAEDADVWEALATVYNAMDPDSAEGVLLANLAALTGTRPQAATYSTVQGVVTLSGAITVPANSIVSVAGQPANQWMLIGGITVGSAGTYPVTFRSAQPGPFVANAGTLTVIVTPVSGWTAVTNPTDATPGLAADTDATLRIKREEELSGQGGGDVDSLRAKLLKVPGVLQAFVFENQGLLPDVNGVPGKAFRAVIWDGASPSASNAAIAQAIWNNKSGGIQPYGAQSGVATDSQGNSQTVFFDRVTQVPIYVTLTTTPGSLTTDQTNAIKAALAAYGLANFQIAQPVIALALRSAALIAGIDTDVPTFFLGTAPSPAGTGNIAMSALQMGTLVTTNTLVNGI